VAVRLEVVLDDNNGKEPEMKTRVIIARLVDKVSAAGLEPEDLDDLVHELAASVAADVNNGGLDEQIAYLIEGMGAEHAEQQLDQLIEGQPREEE
jgi:hypothetical protein